MVDRVSLEDQLRGLSDDLTSRGSVAPRVMREVRGQLAASGSIPASKRKRRWAVPPAPRYTAAMIVISIFVVGVVVWMRAGVPATALAFAEVQEAVRNVKTAVVVVEYPDYPHRDHRLLLRRDSQSARTEWANGLVWIRNGREGKMLVLNPEAKTAVYIPSSLGDVSTAEMLDKMARIEEEAVRPLGRRELDGRTLVGFVVDVHGNMEGKMKAHVWVDPDSRLPVRVESKPMDPKDIEAALVGNVVMQLSCNEPLDASLFSVTPPEGYTLSDHRSGVVYMPVPPAPGDSKLASPTVTFGRGIGKARFGMSVDEVVDVLGRPEEASPYGSFSPEKERALEQAYKEAAAKGLDDFERNKLLTKVQRSFRDEKLQREGMALKYQGRGFELQVCDTEGLKFVQCHAPPQLTRGFTGRTSRGIGMGATREQIEEAYGKPDHVSGDQGWTILWYNSLRDSFQLEDGRLWSISAGK